MQKLSVALLFSWALLAVTGCRATGGASAASGGLSATPAADRELAAAYQPGPAGIDDDDDFDPPSPFVESLSTPFRAIGRGFAAMFSGPTEMIQRASGNTSHKAALKLEDKNSADNRRDGLNRLMEFPYAHQPPYTRVYQGMAGMDEDPTVRAVALRACNRSRDPDAGTVFVKALSDKSELVRLEAAKGLANISHPNAPPVLAGVANNADESRDVRIAAVDALKYYRTLEVARVLSSLLSDRDFSVCWQARRSLVFLTHQDFGYDTGAWLGYFTGSQKPLG